MTRTSATTRQIHDWFLHRGRPLVLTRRVRSRRLIERSAPVSGLYFTVNTSVDPLIADVAVSLAGRDAYLAMTRSSDTEALAHH